MQVSIIGTGHVGATLACNLVLEGLCQRLVLVNRNANTARGHALDLQHMVSLTPHNTRITAGSAVDTAGSDVIVITCSVAMDAVAPDRLSMADGNTRLLRSWLPTLVEHSPDAVVLMVTNPVDVMVWAALKISQLPAERVLGIGTLVDSARFRSMMSQELQIHPDDIRGYILGEHGNTQVAAISVANVGGEQIDESLDRARAIAQQTVRSGLEVFFAKGYTNFAVAKATARVIESIRDDSRHTMPVSVLLDGYCGIDDVALSVPVVIGRRGVTRRLHPRLKPDEVEAFRQSAATVRGVCRQIEPLLSDAAAEQTGDE